MFRSAAFLLVTLCVPLLPASVGAREKVRVATYNIQFLKANIPQERADRIKDVISRLDADVIGLQEIDDRAALERVFDPTQWQLVIDDESGDTQDLAVAVRKPFKVVRLKGDPTNGRNAGDEDFLYPAGGDNSSFPNRRDVLCVEVAVPETDRTLFVLVHHAKARVGGRHATEERRVGAARLILQALEARFDEREFVLLGDFNDNGDDRSLNILETGIPNAPAMMEETDGPFLINLCEPLLKAGLVTHGRRETDIVGDLVRLTDPQSRQRNFDALGTNTNTGDILFENLLIPVGMKSRCPDKTAHIFNHAAGVRGTSTTRASDHLPVYVDLSYEDVEDAGGEGAGQPAGLRIAGLLPNPDGPDDGNEWVELTNGTAAEANVDGWRLRDRAGNVFNLSGTIAAGGKKRFTLPAGSMPLNNGGDDVALVDTAGQVKHRVSYAATQVKPGKEVTFD